MKVRIDVEVYDAFGDDEWAQERFLVHGSDDVLWTSDPDEAVEYVRRELLRAST